MLTFGLLFPYLQLITSLHKNPGGTWVNFCRVRSPGRVCAAGLSDPILVTLGQICNFRDANLVTFYFYEWTHFFSSMRNTLLFTYSTNILVRLLTVNMNNCLTPKNPKMCDPILVTLLKRRPNYSQSSREEATPSSGTCPSASYKEVPPPPGIEMLTKPFVDRRYLSKQ